MSFSLVWLPEVLRKAGLEVEEVPGWLNRGHGDEGKVMGVLCHHTCGPLHGDCPDMSVLVNGRPDLGGPLCNLALGRSGKFYAVAAGKGWHAGRGFWQGVSDGNAHFIGIEAENTGEKVGPRADVWPKVQMEAYVRGCAAILAHIGARSIMCAGHKEFALPKGRKDDPDFDMNDFRAQVAKAMGEKAASYPRKAFVHAADGLKLRSAANAAAAAMKILADGTELEVTGEEHNGDTTWLAVAGGGFVAARYVTW